LIGSAAAVASRIPEFTVTIAAEFVPKSLTDFWAPDKGRPGRGLAIQIKQTASPPASVFTPQLDDSNF